MSRQSEMLLLSAVYAVCVIGSAQYISCHAHLANTDANHQAQLIYDIKGELSLDASKGRSILQHSMHSMHHADAEAPGPKPEPLGPPLVLPQNPMQTCTLHQMKLATSCKGARAVYKKKGDPDVECCQLLSSYFSDASKKPTRNCLCDPDVWSQFSAIQKDTRLTFGKVADACRMNNITVGDAAVNYFQDGQGPCNGYAPVEMGEMEEEEKPKPRTFAKWMREALPDNPWIFFSFVVSMFSVLGFLFIVFPFIFHAVLTLLELPAKLQAKKSA